MDEQAYGLVRDYYDRGVKTPEIISMNTGLDLATVEKLLIRVAQKTKPKRQASIDILRSNLDLLQELVETAQWEYRSDPDVDNATAVTSMVSAMLATIKEIESRKDPTVLLNEMLGRSIQPLVRAFIKSATVLGGRARDQLLDALPPQHHSRVDHVLKELVKQIGQDVSAEYRKTVEAVAGILDCKPEDGIVQPLLQTVLSRENEVNNGLQKEEEGAGSSKNVTVV